MKYVGKSLPPHDAWEKATGQQVYAGDFEVKGMLHGHLITSEIAHGKVTKIDASEALKVEGVVDVITCFDAPEKMFSRFGTRTNQPAFFQEKVFNTHVKLYGDRIGAVVATSEDVARKAVKLVKVTYEEYEYSTNFKDTLSGKIDGIHEEGAVGPEANIVLGNEESIKEENLIEVFSTAYLSRVNHLTLEPHGAVASYNKAQKTLEVWSSNQSVNAIRIQLGRLFNMPYNKIIVKKTCVGGSFGAKQEFVVEHVAAFLSMKVNKPVRVQFTREQAILGTIGKTPMYSEMTAYYNKDGIAKGYIVDNTSEAGAFIGNSVAYTATVAKKFNRVYKIPYINYKGRTTITNAPCSGAFRGWAAPEATCFQEHNFDKAAKKLNIDRVEIRRKNLAKPNTYDIGYQASLGEIKGVETLDLCEQKFNWEKLQRESDEFNKTSKRYKRGVGVGISGHVNGFYPTFDDFASTTIMMADDGSCSVLCQVHDIGSGSDVSTRQIVAEELEIDYDLVGLVAGDSQAVPHDVGAYSSRQTVTVGKSAQIAAKQVKLKFLEVVSQCKNIDINNLSYSDGKVRSKCGQSFTVSEVCHMSFYEKQKQIIETGHFQNVTNVGCAGAHMAHIEVDTYTGFVKCLKYVAVHDIGKRINPELCNAQLQGSVTEGMGIAFTEYVKELPKGKFSGSLKDYHVVNAFDAPNVECYWIEDSKSDGPFNAKAIGESAICPVVPAFVGALNQALNILEHNIPYTPEKIVELTTI